MKILTTLFVLLSFTGFSQSYFNDEIKCPDEHKKEYRYLLLYRECKSFMKLQFEADTYHAWVIRSEVFDSLNQLVSRLTNQTWQGKRIDIQESDLIGIYDLQKAKKIEVVLKIEHKIQPRQVVIEKDEWDESYYELKNQ